ncbi:MAG TPA: winged helix-turn-helix domain-containing protein [Micromonosporaceae bacterium]|nr:winged helix-turn-helix domain-containing protein [Micromonosporaceae bacterium]
MATSDVPLVVCITPDVGARERLARRLDDCGIVLMVSDVDELRAVFCPSGQAEWATPEQFGVLDLPGDGAAAYPDAVRTLGDLVIDPTRHRVTWQGIPVPLTRLEWDLLGSLASPPVTVWTYERLFGEVWGSSYLGDTSILHSAVKRLRRKLRAAGDGVAVETVRGVGYRLALAN